MHPRYPYIDVPTAATVNYSDVEEVCAYRLLLCKLYECEGGFNLPAKSTPVTREIARQALIWLREVKKMIAGLLESPIPDSSLSIPNSSLLIPNSSLLIPNSSLLIPNSSFLIPNLISGYDMLHRIAHGTPCHGYLREVRLKTADRWLKGDKSIPRTDVALLLLSETDRDIRSLERRYADFAIRVMASWVGELLRNGRFLDTPLSETYRRLEYLLGADLFAFTGSSDQTKVKAQWVKNHILTEEETERLDTGTLWDYAHFIDSIPFSTPAQYERNSAIYKNVLSKIALRPDTHPFTAKAIEMALTRYEALSA